MLIAKSEIALCQSISLISSQLEVVNCFLVIDQHPFPLL